MTAQKPENEVQRLAALRRYLILDTEAEPSFDRITALASQILQVPISLISLVDEERQWFKSRIRFPERETAREVSFCAHTILSNKPMIVSDAHQDPRFSQNPSVVGAPFIRFYAGVPLATPDGFNLGSLCAIDQRPRSLSPEQLSILSSLAEVVSDLIEARLSARARQIFEKVAEISPDSIYLFDLKQKRTIYTNRESARVLGYEADGLRQEQMLKAIHPEDIGNVSDLGRFSSMKDGERSVLSYRVRAADGEYRWLQSSEIVFTRDSSDEPSQMLGIATDITALKEAHQKVAELSVTDPLTELPNVRALRERLRLLSYEGGRGRRFAVVLADIDHFKKVNDIHGHQMGDEVLSIVAKTLRANIRVTDFVARYGGEEFVILFSDVSVEIAQRLAENLRRAVSEAESPVPVTCSFGVCSNESALTNDSDLLLKMADEALYTSKRSGRNRVTLASPFSEAV